MAKPVSTSDQRPQPVDRRERLLDSAIKLFSARSYDEVSVVDIAAEADVAIGLLYYHFTDKRGLYAAALQQLADRLSAAAREASDQPAAPVDRLRAALRAELKVMAESPAAYRVLLGAGPQPSVRVRVDRERDARLKLISECLPPGAGRTATVTATLEGWLQFTDGVVLAWLAGRRTSPQEIVNLCVSVLLASAEAAKRLAGKPGETLK
jgi:AcrR family transcriptional regulator